MKLIKSQYPSVSVLFFKEVIWIILERQSDVFQQINEGQTSVCLSFQTQNYPLTLRKFHVPYSHEDDAILYYFNCSIFLHLNRIMKYLEYHSVLESTRNISSNVVCKLIIIIFIILIFLSGYVT